MAGDCPGKTRIEDVDVFIHEPTGADGATNIHIDIEHPLLAQIIEEGESTYCGGKGAGVFIGLTTEQAPRAEAVAAQLQSNQPTDDTTDDSDPDQ